MTLDLERPLRNPDLESPPLMSKRARWLVVLGFLLPGSAQVLAGNRKLGRFGLAATFTLIGIAILALLGVVFARSFTISVLTNGIVLLVAQWLVLAYAVLWLVLGFNTLVITRLVRVSKNWRVPVAMLAAILTLVPVAGAAWASSVISAARPALDLFAGAPPVDPVDGRYNILLLGADAGDDREGLRPDSISLISVDAETGQSMIVGLPRELVSMPFPESSPMHEIHPNGYGVAPNEFGEWGGCNVGDAPFCRLNALNTEMSEFLSPNDASQKYGNPLYPDAVSRGSTPGIEATKDAVTGATGLEVQFYVLIDMDGFSKLIDALGGVDMTVKERLPVGGNIDEYTGELVNVDEWIEPGDHHLDGWHALWYARSRYGSANGDYDRMERQRELQAAILAQMNPQNVLLRFQDILEAGTALVQTDIPRSMLGAFVNLADDAREHTPVTVELTPPAVDPESPDYAAVRELVAEGVASSSPQEETEGE
ncbi:LCP family glycopolymer transferase [Leucobacter sp. GX24907]